jgi:4-amino-4-deoxy-L-arabinose transferase-like glycosyltransferase
VAALALVLLTYGLDSFGLLEDNEARFFEISWEMARSGDWLTPRLNFINHFHKPPGTFWLVGGSLTLFGESEGAGRLPIALAALVTVGLTWQWAAREGGGRAEAARAVLVLVTSLEFWFLSRLVLTDMFLTLTVMIAMSCAWKSRQEPSGHHWLGFWLAAGASVLFKGPIGFAIVAPVLCLFSLTSQRKASWNLRPRLGVPICLALALPWYLAVCWQHQGLLDYFLGFQTADRLLTTVHGRSGAWWFYLPVLLAGFFPWSTGLGVSITAALKRQDDLDRLLLIWIAVPLLFFSCAGSKLPTYLLPIFPALALLTARAGRQPADLRRLGTLALWTLLLFGTAVGIYVGLGVSPELAPASVHLTAIAVLIGLACPIALGRGRMGGHRLVWAAGAFAACLMILASALGPCDRAYSARSLAKIVTEHEPPICQVVEVADHLHGLPFYLRRRLVQVAYPRETQFETDPGYRRALFPDLDSYFAQNPPQRPTLIILRRSDYDSHANPKWPRQDVGRWVLLRPGPAAAPELPIPPQDERTGPVSGGAGLQRGGQPGRPG